MKARMVVIGLVLLSVGASAPTTTQSSSSSSSSSSSRRGGYSERYGLLEDRNIFVRERASRRGGSRTSGPSTQSAPRPPEERFVLTGVVFEEDGPRAYVENDRAETLRLAPGDKVARGRVAAIVIDAIRYEPATGNGATATTMTSTTAPTTNAAANIATPAQPVWVEIGCDLTGKPSSLLASSSASSSSSAAATTSPASPTTGPTGAAGPAGLPPDLAKLNPNDPSLSTEQRMRLRSAMERQRK